MSTYIRQTVSCKIQSVENTYLKIAAKDLRANVNIHQTNRQLQVNASKRWRQVGTPCKFHSR